MERQFQAQLDEVRRLLLVMGGEVEAVLTAVHKALSERNSQAVDVIAAIETRINKDQIDVDEACLNFLAKQGPVATDLRLVVSILKINNELERIGDQCKSISYLIREHLARNERVDLEPLKEMAAIASRMSKDSLDCFVRRDEALAQKVLESDDELDQRRSQCIANYTKLMKSDPSKVESGLELIFIARNLERIGDHATNIAEDVIYYSSGKDVRHGKFN